MANMTNETRVITAGNDELDSRLGGGIPVGSLVLIEGGSGVGKSVLAQQLVYGSLLEGFTVSLFTTENSVKSLAWQMQGLSLDVLDFLLLGKLRVYPIELTHLGEEASDTLLQCVKMESKQDIIIVDSFTSAAMQSQSETELFRFFEECKRLCARGKTIIVTLHSQAVHAEMLDTICAKSDAHLRLRSERDGQRIVKTLEVAKVRGATKMTGAIVGFDVEPGWGMRVIPISKARG